MRGVIVKKEGKRAYAFIDNNFVEVKGSKYQVGDYISNAQINSYKIKRLAVVATMIVCIFTFSVVGYCMPVQYVNVDMLSGIEIGVNVFDRTVSAKGINKEGEALLKEVNVFNKSIDDTLSIIVEKTKKSSYAKNSNLKDELSVTIYSNDKTKATKTEKIINDVINKAVEVKPEEKNAQNSSIVPTNSPKPTQPVTTQAQAEQIVDKEQKPQTESIVNTEQAPQSISEPKNSNILVEKTDLKSYQKSQQTGVSYTKNKLIEEIVAINPNADVEKLKKSSERQLTKLKNDLVEKKERIAEKEKQAQQAFEEKVRDENIKELQKEIKGLDKSQRQQKISEYLKDLKPVDRQKVLEKIKSYNKYNMD